MMNTKKEIYFSIAEKEIINWMVNQAGTTQIEAVEHVISQKRELAYIHGQRGNLALQRQLLKEINEWDDQAEQDYQNIAQKEQKIYVPG